MDQNLFLNAILRWVGDAIFDGKTSPFHIPISATD